MKTRNWWDTPIGIAIIMVIIIALCSIFTGGGSDGPRYPLEDMSENQEMQAEYADMTSMARQHGNDPCYQDIMNGVPPEYARCGSLETTATSRPYPTAVSTSQVCVTVPSLNVRAGPGINYSLVGPPLSQGQCVDVLGCNPDSTWLKISNDGWISANYVAGFVDCHGNLQPVATEYQAPITTLDAGCPAGCTYHKAGCDIKGNVSFDTPPKKIYHLPGDTYYDETVIDPTYGERWFCTEDEARANGWRHAYP